MPVPDRAADAAARSRLTLRCHRGATVALTTLALVLSACNAKTSAASRPDGESQTSSLAAVPPASAPPSRPLVSGLPDFTPLVDKVGPSVVNIRTMEKTHVARGVQGGSAEQQMDELLRRFFGVPLPDNSQRRQQPSPGGGESERPTGVGSGFIISPDGYILTNAHVVDGADDLVVTLPDKREFKAKVVGKDSRSDVAVVKIDARNLPAVTIGNVANLKVGQWVMAIGSPFGLENSVTAGIVSAKQRDTGDYLPFIQSDVAINPGNSGGPLINMAGEVVGINSQIYSRSGGFMGISFSIPINEAMRIANQLRATGSVTRGQIGVTIGTVEGDVAESMGLGKDRGAVVRGVMPGSPAEKAGVQAGDIITRFNGTTIERTSDLPRLVGDTAPGTRASMTVLRNGSSHDLTITVGKLTEGSDSAASSLGSKAEPGSVASVQRLGLSVGELSTTQRQQLHGKGGVVVREVEDGSPADRAGLQAGDVILSIGNQPVANVAAFGAAVARLPLERPAVVLLQRGDWAQYTLIKPTR